MDTKISLRIPFVYCHCRDIAAVRDFYVTLLGMTEKSYMNTPEFAWLNLDAGGFELMFFRADGPMAPKPFAGQPGDGGGAGFDTSWSVQVPEAAFAATYARLKGAKVEAMTETPTWRQESYWGITVKDPAGNTVEVYTAPAAAPASTTWQ